MNQYHLNLCCSFGTPTIVVFTKNDGCLEHFLKISKEELGKIIHPLEVSRRPCVVRNEQDISTYVGKLHTLAPIFENSCVTGEVLILLRKNICALPKRQQPESKVNHSFEFLVENIFNVTVADVVVSGLFNAGNLNIILSFIYN